MQTAAFEIANYLSKSKWKSQVITNRYPRTLKYYDRLESFDVYRYDFLNNPSRYLLSGRLDIFFAWFFYKPLTIIRLITHFYKTRPKIVNLHFPDHQLLECYILKILFDFKLIISLHGHEVTRMGLLKKSSFKYKLYKNLFDSAICITGCSKYLINKFKISFPQIDSGKYLKLLNGVSKDFIFNQLSINKRNYFFSAGRFVNEKGFDLLISCFNPNKMDKLLIAGGNHKDLKKLGIQAKDNILLLGRLNKDEIIEKLLQAKITIIPSRHETFGIFILEAICCGSPVIATNVGGVKELIDDVKIKLSDEEKETFDHWVRIVEPDAQSITKEMIDLDNTKRSKEDYILTIQKIRRQFVWEKRLEHYEKLIRENFKHAVQ